MSFPIISVHNLGKQYRLGAGAAHNTLRDHIASAAKSVASLFKKGGAESAPSSFWALKDVNFEIAQGDVVGVIGRNGAGKSTLLKILSQITEPTEGEVRIRGRIASLLEVGTGFHSELTGRENIFLNGAILGMSKAEIKKKFDEIIAFSEVEKFLDTPVKHYSSGMSMRLAFAVAAHLEPEILLIDEVLAVGDAKFQQKCLGKMGEVAKAGRTVLFVSHNMAAMAALCKTGFYFEKGRFKNSGPIGEVINQYISDTMSGGLENRFCADTRTGSGTVRISDLEVTSDKLSNAAVSGGKMRITITYAAGKAGLPIQFLVGIFDNFDTRLMALDSMTVEDLPKTFPERGKIVLEFPELFSLYPGRYRINVAAVLNGENVDFIRNALVFDVQEGDFFGTGKSPYGKSSVLLRNKWTLVPC